MAVEALGSSTDDVNAAMAKFAKHKTEKIIHELDTAVNKLEKARAEIAVRTPFSVCLQHHHRRERLSG